MKNNFVILLLVLLLNACSTFKSLQSVETEVPCVGAIGHLKSGVFSKAFQKVGKPNILEDIAVSVQRRNFTNSTFTAYRKSLEKKGKAIVFDSTQTQVYFDLRISDFVALREWLNHESNVAVLQYLENDTNLTLLTGISFVANMELEQLLEDAHHITLNETEGQLALQIHNTLGSSEIPMRSLEVFDFETSGFCWQEDKRGRPVIALIVESGKGCPREMEKNAWKLNGTKKYLKL